MTEKNYQSKVIKDIEALGGIAINGIYTKSGELDLQCGFPIKGKLVYLAVEMKSEVAYTKLLKGLTTKNGLYVITDKSKLANREVLQVYKINKTRKLGGLALFAWNINQVLEYINDTKTTPN